MKRIMLVSLVLLSLVLSTSSSMAQELGPEEIHFELVGQIGGPTQAVALQGNYAYVGVGLRLEVLDVSDPADLYVIGSTSPFPHSVEDIVISGTLAYVAAGGAGLRVVDISDPTRPTEIGTRDSLGYAEGVAVVGNIVFLADGPYGLRMIDVSDPTHPTEVGSVYDMNYAFGVVVVGHYAYIAAAGAGLLVADISDPAHPVELASLDTPGYAYGVDVVGSTVYVADGWEGLRVVDISDPADLNALSHYDTPGWALSIAVSDSVAYIADGSRGLIMVDVADETQPFEVGVYEMVGVAVTVAVKDETVYLADDRMGLRVIDVSEIQSPTQIGIHAPLAEAIAVDIHGNYAYVAAGYNGLRIVDISNPFHPREVSTYSTGNYASEIVVSGTHAYLSHFFQGTQPDSPILHVLDISEPASPTMVGTFGMFGSHGSWFEINLVNEVLYVADEWGLRLIDVSDPTTPTQISFIHLEEEPGSWGTDGVAIYSDIAYVTAGGRLNIVDVSDLSNPSLVEVRDWDGLGDMTVAGGRAYAATGFHGMEIVDISVPTVPTPIGVYNTPGGAESITISGTLAYVSDSGGGVQIVDISDPANPTLVEAFGTPGAARRTAVQNNYVYVADRNGGLLVLEATNLGLSSNWGGANSPPLPLAIPSTSSRQVQLVMSYENQTLMCEFSGCEMCPRVVSSGRSTTAALIGSALHTNAITCTVTSTADSGQGTFRWCLVNTTHGDTIVFAADVFSPTYPVTITLISELPPITQSNLLIDASNAGVILDGGQIVEYGLHLSDEAEGIRVKGLQILNLTNSGISVAGNHNTIGGDRTIGTGPTGEGNLISSNGYANVLIGGSYNTVIGNLIGTDIRGENALGGRTGVDVMGTDNRVGGTTPGERNIISGNTFGVYIHPEGANDNVVIGNYIGTDITGTKAVGNIEGVVIEWVSGNVVKKNVISGNYQMGVVLTDPQTMHNTVIGNYIGTDASGTVALGNNTGVATPMARFNRIGGTTPSERNIISGNQQALQINGVGFSDNIFIGNFIGLDVTGTRIIGNGSAVDLSGATQHNFIGGITDGEKNVISGNAVGVKIGQAGTAYNWVIGNYIGTDASGTITLGNNLYGVSLEDYALHNVVQDNLIAYNAESGVNISCASYNTLRRNSIHSHPDSGIVLADGGNNMLLAPVITAVTEMSVSGTACPGCTVEVFSDAEDEGRVYEGSAIADASGAFAFSKGSTLIGPNITATATDTDGNTSEFSAPQKVWREWIYLPVILKGQ